MGTSTSTNNVAIRKCQKCGDPYFGKAQGGKMLCYWCNTSREASLRMEKFYGRKKKWKKDKPKNRRYSVAPPTDGQMEKLIKEVIAESCQS